MPQTSPTNASADLVPASFGLRVLALFVDWVTCLAVVEGLVAAGVIGGNPNGLGTLGLSPAKAEAMAREAGFTRFRKLPVDHAVNSFYEVRP